MNGQITSSAHSALQYIISKAMLEGKLGETVLEIPMTDIYNAYEGPRFHDDASALVLRLRITTEWAEGNPEGDFQTDLEGDIGFNQGDNEDGN